MYRHVFHNNKYYIHENDINKGAFSDTDEHKLEKRRN